MNLTILSLSISSIYSDSPLFIGNRNCFSKHYIHKYFTPTIILNPEQLLIQKSVFSYGIGSILHSNSNKKLLEDKVKEFVGETFTDSNLDGLNPPNEKSLIVIRDCNFNNIRYANQDDGKNSHEHFINNFMIKILSNCTFYMTNCLFDSCYFNKTALFLATRATTISHICCNKLHGGQEGEALFINSNTPRGSFFKFIYSTFYGNYENFPTQTIFKLGGTCALRYQCINISHFVLGNSNDRSITRIESTACLTMLMNTFYHCDAEYVLWINIHDGDTEGRYNHYCGLTNFHNNKQQTGIIYFDMQSHSRITLDECYFSNENVGDGEKMKSINGNAKIYISNCYFQSWLNENELNGRETINIHNNVNNLQTMTLAHYTVIGKCDAIHVIDAFGCQNDTCPDSKGCETFGFVDGDVKYTEVFHPDINTPTPTPTLEFTISFPFTNSMKFTYSKQFSNSEKFTKSNDFSRSRSFSASHSFSKSGSFTKSNLFTKSSQFTKSHSFSGSRTFTSSSHFSASRSFTGSHSFSGSHSFTFSSSFSKSGIFTNSKDFSSSFYFTKTSGFTETKKFSETKDFSSSFYFSKTSGFTETKKFSETKDFSKSQIFSESANFTQSNSFTPSRHFDASRTFTPSKKFSPSSEFNESSVFSDSSIFSYSSGFSLSSFFSDSVEFSETAKFSLSTEFSDSKKFTFSEHFSNSEKFSDSEKFSKSEIFSETKTFTESRHFDATGTFTPSHTFSQSSHFSNSFFFTKSGEFSGSSKFTISTHFTSSFHFTSSLNFTSSKEFTPSNHFGATGTFTASNEFTHSKMFTQSNTIKSNVAITINQSQGSNKMKIIGGVIGAVIGAGLIAAIIFAIIFLRHRRHEPSSDMFEELNTIDDPHSSITYNNVLHGLDMEDDPFHDDFNDVNDGNYHHFD